MASAGNTIDPLLDVDEYDLVCRQRLQFAVPVTQPLVLISQAQRSGGTLLSQLFDGHPECHAHPHELHIGHPSSRDWPPLDLSDPQSWFDLLFERKPAIHLQGGYTKGPEGEAPAGGRRLPVSLHAGPAAAHLRPCVGDGAWSASGTCSTATSPRTSTPGSTITTCTRGPKKVVTDSLRARGRAGKSRPVVLRVPRRHADLIVRDPFGLVRVREQARPQVLRRPGGRDRHVAELDGARSMPRPLRRRVVVLTYARLVQETERDDAADRRTDRPRWSDMLLTPTFNAQPIRANSQAEVGHGVIAERATAYRDSLDEQTIGRIGDLAGDLYERAELAAA